MIKTLSYFCAEFKRSFSTAVDVDDDEDEAHSDPLIEKRTVFIPTQTKTINRSTNLREHYRNNIVDYVKRQVDEVMLEGSGFTLGKIVRLTVQIFKFQPIKGSQYIELLKKLKNKRAIINLKNTDDQCFKWAILAALHHDEVQAKNDRKVNDVSRYAEWVDELNFDGIDFPVQLNQIEKFMKQNESIAVNVYYFESESECIRPLFLAMKPFESIYVHLLLLSETASSNREAFEVGVHSHYCWIKNFNALMLHRRQKTIASYSFVIDA